MSLTLEGCCHCRLAEFSSFGLVMKIHTAIIKSLAQHPLIRLGKWTCQLFSACVARRIKQAQFSKRFLSKSFWSFHLSASVSMRFEVSESSTNKNTQKGTDGVYGGDLLCLLSRLCYKWLVLNYYKWSVHDSPRKQHFPSCWSRLSLCVPMTF